MTNLIDKSLLKQVAELANEINPRAAAALGAAEERLDEVGEMVKTVQRAGELAIMGVALAQATAVVAHVVAS